MDRERAEHQETEGRNDRNGEDPGRGGAAGELRSDGGSGPGPTPAAPGPAPRKTDDADESPTWLEILLPILIVLLLTTLAMLWNIVAAIVVLILGVGVILSWVIQRREPHEPGD